MYQRILSGIIRKYNLSAFCINFIDDTLIFSKSFKEHIQHLRLLFSAIANECFRLKFLKCEFAKRKVKYLGHTLEQDKISPLTDNVVAIRDFPVLTSKKNVCQFLGKVNFYHPYIPNCLSLIHI